jgi:hypothetical protein
VRVGGTWQLFPNDFPDFAGSTFPIPVSIVARLSLSRSSPDVLHTVIHQRKVVMFVGKAELVDPEKNTAVATFTERCHGDGTAHMRVVLKTPMTISGTERLAIYSTIRNQEVVSVTATGGTSTEIREFDGKSSLGCLAVSRTSH